METKKRLSLRSAVTVSKPVNFSLTRSSKRIRPWGGKVVLVTVALLVVNYVVVLLHLSVSDPGGLAPADNTNIQRTTHQIQAMRDKVSMSRPWKFRNHSIDESTPLVPRKTPKPISDNEGTHIVKTHAHRAVSTDNTNVFFNVYVSSKGGVAAARSIRIAREQVRQMANSTLRNNTLFYNLIGAKKRLNLCDVPATASIHCEMLHHYPTGNEELTLQALYDYCQGHPVEKVVYMHNKGSFREQAGNTKIRRLSTTAVTSHACLEMPLSDEYPCNVCGLTFQSKPYFHMTANFWMAECSYVRELLPPKVYTIIRTDWMQKLFQEEKCLTDSWDLDNVTFLKNYGLGRYAMERWLFSHPGFIPCDVIPFRIARFRRGFEDWFMPTLRWSRHMIWDEADLSERREIWFSRKEFQELYKHKEMNMEPNWVFLNYTGNVLPSPCL